jgi:RimJ/RimL family protein N-acetyltransferase
VYTASDVITTERLILRRPKPADAKAKYEYSRDPEVARYMDWVPHPDLGSALAVVERAAARWESGEEYSWVITVKPADLAVGSVGCHMQRQAVELGFVLARPYWGQGYATEAAKAVFAWAASCEGVCRIWATCDIENTGSTRVLAKLGMVREGILRRWAFRPNLAPAVPRDAVVYSWVREA